MAIRLIDFVIYQEMLNWLICQLTKKKIDRKLKSKTIIWRYT